MLQSGEERVQPKMGRLLGRAAAALLFAAALCQPGIAHAGPHGGAVGSRRRRLPRSGDSAVGSMPAASTAAAFMLAVSMAVGSMAVGSMAVGSMVAGFTAAGWACSDTPILMDMITIRTTAMTPGNPAPRRPGTIAPIRRVITRT